jgi:methanogenic corrinoid protein MtbC1
VTVAGSSSSPTGDRFSIGEVVAVVNAHDAGVTPSSLRFLEREGLLRAQRTAGGHRFYTAGDVERILLIRRWQREGLTLELIHGRLVRLDSLPATNELSAQLVQHFVQGNLRLARDSVLATAETGMLVGTIFGDILEPALVEVGRRWESGDLLVAQEKEITELARGLIIHLAERNVPPAEEGATIVAACVEGESHDLGLRMLCGLLRMRGYRVHFLGPDVSAGVLLDSVALNAPVAVLLSASLGSHLGALAQAVHRLLEHSPRADGQTMRVIVGGHAVSTGSYQAADRDVVVVTGGDLSSALEAIEDAIRPRVPRAGS